MVTEHVNVPLLHLDGRLCKIGAILCGVAERAVRFRKTLAVDVNAVVLDGDGVTTDDVQWAKDMTKYLYNPSGDFSLSENASVVLSIDAVTYGGEAIPVPEEDQIIQVLTGKDCVKVENGQLIGVSEGTATVIYGYKARTNISKTNAGIKKMGYKKN